MFVPVSRVHIFVVGGTGCESDRLYNRYNFFYRLQSAAHAIVLSCLGTISGHYQAIFEGWGYIFSLKVVATKQYVRLQPGFSSPLNRARFVYRRN